MAVIARPVRRTARTDQPTRVAGVPAILGQGCSTYGQDGIAGAVKRRSKVLPPDSGRQFARLEQSRKAGLVHDGDAEVGGLVGLGAG